MPVAFGAKKSGNESMVEILTKKIEAGVDVPAVTAKRILLIL